MAFAGKNAFGLLGEGEDIDEMVQAAKKAEEKKVAAAAAAPAEKKEGEFLWGVRMRAIPTGPRRLACWEVQQIVSSLTLSSDTQPPRPLLPPRSLLLPPAAVVAAVAAVRLFWWLLLAKSPLPNQDPLVPGGRGGRGEGRRGPREEGAEGERPRTGRGGRGGRGEGRRGREFDRHVSGTGRG